MRKKGYCKSWISAPSPSLVCGDLQDASRVDHGTAATNWSGKFLIRNSAGVGEGWKSSHHQRVVSSPAISAEISHAPSNGHQTFLATDKL
jgi:hypothetical protein